MHVNIHLGWPSRWLLGDFGSFHLWFRHLLRWTSRSGSWRAECGGLGGACGRTGEIYHLRSYSSGHTHPEREAGKGTIAVCPVGKRNLQVHSPSLPECGRHSYFLKLSLLSFSWHHSLGSYLPIRTACFQAPPQLLFLLSPNVGFPQHSSQLVSLLTTWFSLKDFINKQMFIFNAKPASGFISPHLDKWASAQSLN